MATDRAGELATDVGVIPTSSGNYSTTIENNLTIHKVPNDVWMNNASLRTTIENAITNAGANELFIINADKEKYVNVSFVPSYETLSSIVTRVLQDLTLQSNTVSTASFDGDILTLSNTALSSFITVDSTSTIADTNNTQNLILNNSSALSGTLQTNKNGNNIADNYKVIEEWKYNLE